MKKGDLLIRGGTIVDPARNILHKGDLLICGRTIAEIASHENVEAKEIIEATDCLVTPGLIDSHLHLFWGGTECGIMPDLSLLPMGVTSAVDAGSAGIANCEGLMNLASNCRMRIFSYLNISQTGLVTEGYPECLDPKYYDLERMQDLFGKYAGRIIGIKVREGEEIVGKLGLEPLKEAVKIAEALGCRVNVHTTNPAEGAAELASILRPGDIFGHCFHGKGSTIIDENLRVKAGIRQARTRGVLFDTADGRNNHSYRTIKAALADGFAPDLISTDLSSGSIFGNMVFGLPVSISRYLSLGMALVDVIRACTATPAKIIGMEGKLGILAPGSLADVAVFQLEEKTMTLQNRIGESFTANQLLVPKLTILDGKVVYRQVGF